MPKTDPRVDAYIAEAAPFARPILKRIRRAVRRACPRAEEDLKWGFPHFLHHGMLCSMAAFKAHCAMGFWRPEVRRRIGREREGMGHLGKLTRLEDLPSDRELVRWIRASAALNESGVARRPERKPRPALRVPAVLARALRTHARAAAAFKVLSKTGRNEYIEWIGGAKTDATRDKRLATTLKWLAQGKTLHWQYR